MNQLVKSVALSPVATPNFSACNIEKLGVALGQGISIFCSLICKAFFFFLLQFATLKAQKKSAGDVAKYYALTILTNGDAILYSDNP